MIEDGVEVQKIDKSSSIIERIEKKNSVFTIRDYLEGSKEKIARVMYQDPVFDYLFRS